MFTYRQSTKRRNENDAPVSVVRRIFLVAVLICNTRAAFGLDEAQSVQTSPTQTISPDSMVVRGAALDVFKSIVGSISPASEAQFALLPPDNSSGNFTRITQRVPVKITFDTNEKDRERMRPGMSVIARAWTKLHL